MRKLWVVIVLCIALGVSIGIARYVRGQEAGGAARQEAPVRIASNAMAFHILLGRNDAQPTAWNGSLTVTGGTLMRVEGWRFRQNDKMTGPASWNARSRRVTPNAARQNPNAPVTPNGVVVTLEAGPQAAVQVTTTQGAFTFQPADIAPGKQTPFLNGAAAVERALPAFQVTDAGTEDDFPAAAVGKDGSVWVSYVAYRYGQGDEPITRPLQAEPKDFDFLRPKGNGDQVRLARLNSQGDGAAWSVVADVTDPGQDVSRPAIAVDGGGNVWVVWAQNVKDNWDLYARRYSNGTPGKTLRLTKDTEPDLLPALATDDTGTVWLAWQGFRNGAAGIFLASVPSGSERWSDPVRLTDSPRNAWDPAVACAHDGSVYVAWDTYDKGDYDVLMRRVVNGKPGEVIPVANTPRFEARASLACDAQNRVWVAWEEAPANWGKDFGFVVQNNPPGTPLYRGHTVGLRCFVDGKPYRTASDLEEALPNPPGNGGAGGRRQNLGQQARRGAAMEASFPRLGIDREGRVFLTYRRAVAAIQAPIGTTWLSYVTAYTGNTWTPAVAIPDSDGLLDSRPALVAGGPGGGLTMIHAADGRNHLFGRDPRFEIYASPLSGLVAAANPAPPALVADDPIPPRAATNAMSTSEWTDVDRIRAYRIRSSGKTYQLLRGDYHRHTEISPDGGGDGPLEDMFRYAIDAADQDWICAGDHDYGNGREYTWWQIQKLDDAYHLETKFVPIFGYERSVRYPDGHRNVMFLYRGIRPLPRLSGGQGNGVSSNDTKMLYKYLRAFNAICASHTSATDMGTDWRDNDPELEPIVEIYQGDRQNYEYEGAPRSPSPNNAVGGYEPAGYVWNAFAKGYKLGFQASSDHISTHMSYGVALAEMPTRAAIQDAFRKRHTYAATDNIVLDVRSGDHLMGDEFETSQAPRLHIMATATGAAKIARLIVVKDNKVVFTGTPGQATVDTTWMDNEAKAGLSYYYVRVEQDDGQLAWASPMWIHYKP